jgi:hypothetical protein
VKSRLGVAIILTVLVIVTVACSQKPDSSQPEVPSKTIAGPSTPSIKHATDDKVYFQVLISKGMSNEEAQVLVLHRIKLKYFSNPANKNYWQATTAPHTSLDKLAQARQVRSALLVAFGEEARDKPLFREIFYPWADDADFLSSDEQIALFEQSIKQQLSQAALFSQGIAFEQLEELSPIMHDPSDFLSADSTFEWNLRYSYLADRLRDSGVSFTEQSFRDSYTILAPIYEFTPGELPPTGMQITHASDALAEEVGTYDAIRIQATLDPRFTQFKKLADQQGLMPEQVITAFGIVLEAQAAIARASDLIAVDENRAGQLINQAYVERDNSLASFIGKQRADQLINVFETPALSEQDIFTEGLIHPNL